MSQRCQSLRKDRRRAPGPPKPSPVGFCTTPRLLGSRPRRSTPGAGFARASSLPGEVREGGAAPLPLISVDADGIAEVQAQPDDLVIDRQAALLLPGVDVVEAGDQPCRELVAQGGACGVGRRVVNPGLGEPRDASD